jgi:hypothetical protein
MRKGCFIFIAVFLILWVALVMFPPDYTRYETGPQTIGLEEKLQDQQREQLKGKIREIDPGFLDYLEQGYTEEEVNALLDEMRTSEDEVTRQFKNYKDYLEWEKQYLQPEQDLIDPYPGFDPNTDPYERYQEALKDGRIEEAEKYRQQIIDDYNKAVGTTKQPDYVIEPNGKEPIAPRREQQVIIEGKRYRMNVLPNGNVELIPIR